MKMKKFRPGNVGARYHPKLDKFPLGFHKRIFILAYFRSRNFREQKLSRAEKFAKFLYFASINFRESAKI